MARRSVAASAGVFCIACSVGCNLDFITGGGPSFNDYECDVKTSLGPAVTGESGVVVLGGCEPLMRGCEAAFMAGGEHLLLLEVVDGSVVEQSRAWSFPSSDEAVANASPEDAGDGCRVHLRLDALAPGAATLTIQDRDQTLDRVPVTIAQAKSLALDSIELERGLVLRAVGLDAEGGELRPALDITWTLPDTQVIAFDRLETDEPDELREIRGHTIYATVNGSGTVEVTARSRDGVLGSATLTL
ncbi:MAG: hypothetical protein KC731_32890 [Myxococcales bacterium]|nr:hypothetical protein [Myxococcales bacterium]